MSPKLNNLSNVYQNKTWKNSKNFYSVEIIAICHIGFISLKLRIEWSKALAVFSYNEMSPFNKHISLNRKFCLCKKYIN